MIHSVWYIVDIYLKDPCFGSIDKWIISTQELIQYIGGIRNQRSEHLTWLLFVPRNPTLDSNTHGRSTRYLYFYHILLLCAHLGSLPLLTPRSSVTSREPRRYISHRIFIISTSTSPSDTSPKIGCGFFFGPLRETQFWVYREWSCYVIGGRVKVSEIRTGDD